MSILEVFPSSEARVELPKVLERFRHDGAGATPLVFGAHRKPEAVVIPYELYAELLPAIENAEIARIVRERTAAGPAESLEGLAGELGLDPADFR
ncbi:MAG TPA: hypothetical protein VFM87_01505 [Agrococcus sp.]|nr:hypothetical protein [Agrococcus sp.]